MSVKDFKILIFTEIEYVPRSIMNFFLFLPIVNKWNMHDTI
jgi:hypothetical protein